MLCHEQNDELSRLKQTRQNLALFIGSDFGSGLDVFDDFSINSSSEFFLRLCRNENIDYVIESGISHDIDEYILTTLLIKKREISDSLLFQIYCISTEKNLYKTLDILDSKCFKEETLSEFFFTACKRNKHCFIKYQIKHGFDVNKRDSEGNAGLHIAAQCGSIETIKELILNGADKEAKNNDKCTPLRVAVNNSQEDASMLLLNEWCDGNADDYPGNFLIHFAALNKLYKVVEGLLKTVKNVDLENIGGVTPLYCAIKADDERIVKLLLEHGAKIEITGSNRRTMLSIAISKQNPNIVRLLLDRGADPRAPDKSGEFPYDLAVKYGNKEIIEMLKVEPEIFSAFDSSNVNCIKNYIEEGKDLNILDKIGLSLLYRCIESNYDELAIKLVEKKATIHSTNKSPFVKAMAQKKEEILKAMIKANANITSDDYYFKLLVAAKIIEIPFVVEYLISLQSNIMDPNFGLHCQVQNERCIFNIIENGYFILISSLVKNDETLIEKLIKKGESVDFKSQDGYTPLMCAVINGNKKNC